MSEGYSFSCNPTCHKTAFVLRKEWSGLTTPKTHQCFIDVRATVYYEYFDCRFPSSTL